MKSRTLCAIVVCVGAFVGCHQKEAVDFADQGLPAQSSPEVADPAVELERQSTIQTPKYTSARITGLRQFADLPAIAITDRQELNHLEQFFIGLRDDKAPGPSIDYSEKYKVIFTTADGSTVTIETLYNDSGWHREGELGDRELKRGLSEFLEPHFRMSQTPSGQLRTIDELVRSPASAVTPATVEAILSNHGQGWNSETGIAVQLKVTDDAEWHGGMEVVGIKVTGSVTSVASDRKSATLECKAADIEILTVE